MLEWRRIKTHCDKKETAQKKKDKDRHVYIMAKKKNFPYLLQAVFFRGICSKFAPSSGAYFQNRFSPISNASTGDSEFSTKISWCGATWREKRGSPNHVTIASLHFSAFIWVAASAHKYFTACCFSRRAGGDVAEGKLAMTQRGCFSGDTKYRN